MAIRFITPLDGQMMTDLAGVREGDALAIDVAVEAAPGQEVRINEQRAVWRDGAYHAAVLLDGYRNTVEAACGEEKIKMGIYWIPEATKRFAVSVDDNIWWLQDLNDHPYRSIFDNPYLAVYQEAHDLYGIKLRLNIFYHTDRRGGFDLSRMTDRYRDEFLANHDWLHLAFHAESELPDWPYAEATYAGLKYDYDRIKREVKRFAGYEPDRCTTIHFGSGSRQAVRAIRAEGVRTLMGYMEVADGRSYVSYYLSPEEVAKVNEFGFWKDHGEDMIFGRIDCVMNQYDCTGIAARMDECLRRFPKNGYIEIMIHEQYFYEDYPSYMPDYREKVLTGVRYCVEHGYRPMFSGEATAEW